MAQVSVQASHKKTGVIILVLGSAKTGAAFDPSPAALNGVNAIQSGPSIPDEPKRS
jgi:hypothetical protein